MDRNSIVGLLLIGGILFSWMLYMAPSEEEIARQQVIRDSISQVQKAEYERIEVLKAEQKKTARVDTNSNPLAATSVVLSDSLIQEQKKNIYGPFAEAASGETKSIFIENENLRAKISSLGGRIESLELKDYKTHDSLPLYLFTADSSRFAVQFMSGTQIFSTDSLHFTIEGESFHVNGTEEKQVSLKLYAGDPGKYIEYLYTLKGNSFLLDYDINIVGMQDVIARGNDYLTLNWSMKSPAQEKSMENERNATTIYYKYFEDETDYISEQSDEILSIEGKLKWIAMRQQFFSSILIAEESFDMPPTILETKTDEGSKKYTKEMLAEISFPYSHSNKEHYGLQFYFGPNHYKTLKSYNRSFEELIPLGWGIFGWVNKIIVIPIFNFLTSFNIGMGIVILILTLIIKLLLFPIAYKTYLSSAKMRVLKPEVDEINKKFGKEDAMKKQQAMMALYKKAGVNPMAGCIPMLLQMPILIALFRFFPASIELRQQSFLWATDLSSYDSIYDFGFEIPFYGDHISLFTLLMTISTIIYTKVNSQLMGSNDQMPQMKIVMYLMPIMFLGFFNNYAAGLSYYYFLANMITFGQTVIMRRFVDEEALHKKIEANKKKPAKTSRFQKKIEQMAKEQQNRAAAGKTKKKK